DGLDQGFDAAGDLVGELLPDPLPELVGAHLAGYPAGVPPVVVDAPDQHRQWRRELGALVDGETVAQRVQDGSERGVRLPAALVGPAVRLPDLLEDLIGLRHGGVEGRQPGVTHRALRPVPYRPRAVPSRWARSG